MYLHRSGTKKRWISVKLNGGFEFECRSSQSSFYLMIYGKKKVFLSSRAKSRPATCPSGARRMSPRKGSQQFLPRWAIRKMNRGTKNNDFGENPQIKTSAGRVGAKKLTKASLLTIGDRCRGSWALFENSIEVSDVGSEDHRKSFVKAVEDSNLLEII